MATEPERISAAVLRFLRDDAGFAQLYTVDTAGRPVGRTIGAPVNDDFSVDLVQRAGHRRLTQLAANPAAELIWVGTPLPDSRNDHPPVLDFGLPVPRVLFLRGTAEFLTTEETVTTYRRLTERQRARGHRGAVERSDDNVRTELAGLRIRPVRIRAEGFDAGARVHTWYPTNGALP